MEALTCGVEFELLGEELGTDAESALRTAIESGVDFGGATSPLTVLRSALRSSIRDIEDHPRGRLFQRFLRDGPYEGEGRFPRRLAGQRLTDKETAQATAFICGHMVNTFQGCVAEMLAAALWWGLCNVFSARGA